MGGREEFKSVTEQVRNSSIITVFSYNSINPKLNSVGFGGRNLLGRWLGRILGAEALLAVHVG